MGEEQGGSFIDDVKKALNDSASQGGGMPPEVFYVGKDGVKKVRFLTEFKKEEVLKVVFHDKFNYLMPQPCLRNYGEKCPYHGGGVRTQTRYVFTVYDYEQDIKALLLVKPTMNDCLEDLMDAFESNGTIKDRDFKISKSGERQKARTRAKGLPPSDYDGKFKKPYAEDKALEIMKGMVKPPKNADDEDGDSVDREARKPEPNNEEEE